MHSEQIPTLSSAQAQLLVVEDETNLGKTLVEQLAANGFATRLASSRAEAMQTIAEQQFHLALLDVGLPDGSGFDVARQLHQLQRGCAVIFLTARGDLEDRIFGLELGAEDYIVKPFHLRELMLRIRKVLNRSQFVMEPSRQDILQIGEARIDLRAFAAHRGEQEFRLSHRECALLKFLIERRGQVVSRDEILDFVWSPDEYPTPRTVDNFIVKLRRFVESDPENPQIIRSIRGVGYQLT